MPGWHSTIFPPYFVAGALFSGFAMVLTIAIPLRAAYGLEDFITERHLDLLAKLMLADRPGRRLLVPDRAVHRLVQRQPVRAVRAAEPDVRAVRGRSTGSTWPATSLAIQLLWFRARAPTATCCSASISLLVNVGMWTERFVIVVESLHRDFLPSSWGIYIPTVWDWATLLGTLGLFSFLLFLFIRGAADDLGPRDAPPADRATAGEEAAA